MSLYDRMSDAICDEYPDGLVDTINHIILAAKANADETVYKERAAPESEWDRIFEGSIRDKLSNDDPDYLEPVHAWFANFGVKA